VTFCITTILASKPSPTYFRMTPTVDVCMLTYNHAAFVQQAIESVLAQQTNFLVRLVIGDDGSTDETRALIAAYAQRQPERFKLLFHERNVGIIPNFAQVLESCEAPFIAILDGDDYWTDSHKLQQQIDFLRAHAEFSVSAHDAEMFWQDGKTPPTPFSATKPALQQGHQVFNHADVVRHGWFLPTASLVFRRTLIQELPAWFRTVFSGDYSLLLLLSEAGKVHYTPQLMARYRIHSRGASFITAHNETQVLAKMIGENQAFRDHFSPSHRAHFTDLIGTLQFRLGTGLLKQGRYGGLAQHWRAAISTDSRLFTRNLTRLLRTTVTKNWRRPKPR
jgi:glycosyltransferase involved in cell wall biosynthesis